MHFSTLLMFPLLALAVAAPAAEAAPDALAAPEAAPEPQNPQLQAGTGPAYQIQCTATAANAYRKCTKLSCAAAGTYAKGQVVTFVCGKYGDTVNGYNVWLKGINGYYTPPGYFNKCTKNGIIENC
ncbi:hypothetical protein K440DRAFT_642773 [Wilcoxina mikolae CBS 423.85]|nr:hypothetical protein K440DRAFT_642773 [Wilcoxina mikolae CBS 423.85]